MRDLEKLMLAIYKATVDASKPFADAKPINASIGVDTKRASELVLTLQQRGFLGRYPLGTYALSQSGIAYVEDRLLK